MPVEELTSHVLSAANRIRRPLSSSMLAFVAFLPPVIAHLVLTVAKTLLPQPAHFEEIILIQNSLELLFYFHSA